MIFQHRTATDDQSGNEWTNPYTVWNVAITKKFDESTSIYLKTQNIFDTFDTLYGPYQGRMITFGLRYTYFGDEDIFRVYNNFLRSLI